MNEWILSSLRIFMETPLYIDAVIKLSSKVFVFVSPSFLSASGSVKPFKGINFTAKSIAQ